MSIYVEVRTTAAGTEYWNKDLKRVELFKPGTAPDNIQTEGLVGQYSVGGKVAEVDPVASQLGVSDGETIYDLASMRVAELKELAEKHDIDIPSDVTKKDDIIDYINTNWVSAAELNG